MRTLCHVEVCVGQGNEHSAVQALRERITNLAEHFGFDAIEDGLEIHHILKVRLELRLTLFGNVKNLSVLGEKRGKTTSSNICYLIADLAHVENWGIREGRKDLRIH